MRFQQLSRIGTSERGLACVTAGTTYSPLLAMLDALNAFELTEHKWRFTPIKPQTTALLTRTLGTNYIANDGHTLLNGDAVPLDLQTIDDVTGTLYIHGHYINVDASIIADASHTGVSMTDWMIKQLKQEFKKFYKLYTPLMMKGSGSGELKGLRNILKWTAGTDYGTIEGYREATYNRIYDAALNSTIADAINFDLSIASESNAKQQRAFLELMDSQISDVENPNAIIMNRKTKARIWSWLKTANNFAVTTNDFGTTIYSYNGIPIYELDDVSMPITEPDNTDTTPLTNTTSIYICSFGEQNLSYATNSGVEYTEHPMLEAKEAGQEKWEIRAGWKCENPSAIKVIRNIYLG